MKFRRINDDKIQIILSSEDLFKRNFKKGDLLPSSPRSYEFFQEMLAQAYEEVGFEIDGEAQLVVEAYPMTGDSLVVNLTKVNMFDELEADDMDEDEDFPEYIFNSPVMVEDVVYFFGDMEKAALAASRIAGDYRGKASLYRYKSGYYMVLEETEEISDSCLGLLGEYGEAMNVTASFLDEHAEKYLSGNAVQVLVKLV